MHFPLAIFGIDLEQWIVDLVSHGGYPILFALLFSCGLGLPLPEDIPLLIAGAMVANGKMNLVVAAICAWCGIIGGDCVLYQLGKVFGAEVSRIPLIGRHVKQEHLQRLEARFERWGVLVVAIGRLLAGVRGAMVVCAGAIRFPFWKFLVADGLAAIVSGGLFLGLGYWFGNEMPRLLKHVDRAKQWIWVAMAILAIVGVVWWLIVRRRRRAGVRKIETAQAVVPLRVADVDAPSAH